MVHPYGRYSNANKFARRGGRAGGRFARRAAVVQHRRGPHRRPRASRWAAPRPGSWPCTTRAAGWPPTPGAGFSETPEFLRTFQGETLRPTWWERKLWQQYDCNGWAVNLTHCPTVAYSGENDRQKQAADVMADGACAREGIEPGPRNRPRQPATSTTRSRGLRVDRRIAEIAKPRPRACCRRESASSPTRCVTASAPG